MEDILRGDVPAVQQPQSIQSMPQHNANSEIDRELEEILKKQAARIKVIGIGGGGGNTTSRMREIGILCLQLSSTRPSVLYMESPYSTECYTGIR